MARTGLRLTDLEKDDLLYHKVAIFKDRKFGLFLKDKSDEDRCYSRRLFDNFNGSYSEIDNGELDDKVQLLARKELTTWELN